MKKLFLIVVAGVLCFSLLASSVHAGKPKRNMCEGIAIGLGAAILGNALFNYHPPRPAAPNAYYYPSPSPPPRYGHWGYRMVWVPPVHKRVWNPGHYSHRGRWIPGGWIRIMVRPGHWSKVRVWVSRR